MGLYTSDELIDGDFKEYPMEDMAEQVKKDIQQNANSEDFIVDADVAETVENPQSAELEKVQGEVVEKAPFEE